MDVTEQITPTSDVPAHLFAATAPAKAVRPGACPRCGELESAPLMRSERVDYRLCSECGRVWVERCAGEPTATSIRAVPRDTLVARLLAVVTTAVRFMTAQQP